MSDHKGYPKSCGDCYMDPNIHLEKIAEAARRHAAPMMELWRGSVDAWGAANQSLRERAEQAEARCTELEGKLADVSAKLSGYMDAYLNLRKKSDTARWLAAEHELMDLKTRCAKLEKVVEAARHWKRIPIPWMTGNIVFAEWTDAVEQLEKALRALDADQSPK